MEGKDDKAQRPTALQSKSRLNRVLVLVVVSLALATFLPVPTTWFDDEPVTASSTGWKDNVWPIRESAPWDISTDFPHPRTLEYDVSEGTWLRLDVHPTTGDIVFDMVGDLYCLPASGGTALPILRGVPYDSDPHFSPVGDKLVFRSDAELGLDNIWVMPWSGCDSLTPSSSNTELSKAIALTTVDEVLLDLGKSETAERKRRRLVREGRSSVQRVTNETYRGVTDARFHPSGETVIATKWYTSERSLGAGEGWEYSIPTSGNSVAVGAGKKLVGRTLPAGWKPESYGDQQVGGEQYIWRGNDSLIYSKNIRDIGGEFTYSKDVHKGIYAIFSYNITTGKTETLVDAFPGGASRPELSRDGKTLAFVRRVRDKEALVLKDLTSGTIHHAWDGLTPDLSIVSAPMGTYPAFAFTPSDDAVIIWAHGKIYRVPLLTNARGEKNVNGTPVPIPFTAHIEKKLAKTTRGSLDVVALETASTQRLHAFTELRVNENGMKVVFQAAGVTYVHKLNGGESTKVPVLHPESPYYSPDFVQGAEEFVLHARWSNVNFTSFELADVENGVAHELVGIPFGRFYSPVLGTCAGRGRQIAFVKSGGDYLTGNVVATAAPGLYIGELTLPSSTESSEITVRNVRFISSTIDAGNLDHLVLRFIEGNRKLLVQQDAGAFVVDLVDGSEPKTIASSKMALELVVSSAEVERIAWVDLGHVYVAEGKNMGKDELVWTKPGNATKGVARLSLDGGHDIVWSGDGKKLFWLLGPYLHSLEIAKLDKCTSDINKDTSTFGIGCVRKLLEYEALEIEFSTDIARLKKDTLDADTLVIGNATILTMLGSDDIVRNGVMVVRGGVIQSIGALGDFVVPAGATVIDAQGGFVVPGFIDVHAHWNGPSVFPASSWELETFLSYGVTTLHNPSADSVKTSIERARVENGQIIGPRIHHTGGVVYGAGSPGLHADVVDLADARSTLLRIKVEAGPAGISYKNYNLPSRAARQKLLLSAKELSMSCVPEGGMNQDWDITYIIDGMTTVEHALPVPALFDDVLTLYAKSGTGATPTHIVNYGGAWGEQLVWASEDVPNDPKLRRFTRHDILEGLTESTARPASSYTLFNTSSSVAKMVEQGLHAHIGAHGEPPLGLNYHAEMFFTQQGGLSNYQTLHAATRSAALTLGLDSSIGSLGIGKLADFIVYPPGVDLLVDDIRKTRNIRFVARGGRVWDAELMVEHWPVKGRKQVTPPINP